MGYVGAARGLGRVGFRLEQATRRGGHSERGGEEMWLIVVVSQQEDGPQRQTDGLPGSGADGRPALACYSSLTPTHMSLYPTLILCEPLDSENLPAGLFTLAPYHGDAARVLASLGDTVLAEAMQSSMDPEEARSFSLRLFSAADAVEQQNAHDSPRPTSSFWRRPWNSEEDRRRHARNAQLERVLREIREAARWYKAVSENGLGVHAAC